MKHLSTNEWAVIQATRFDARQSTTAVAKRCNLRTHTVHRILGRLRERGVIKPFLVINPHTLGLTDFCVFFRIGGEYELVRNDLVKICENEDRVVYWADISGDLQFTVSIFANDIFEVQNIIEKFESLSKKASFHTSYAIRLMWEVFNVQTGQSESLVRTNTNPKSSIDKLDSDLIRVLQKEPDLAFTHLGRLLGVSEGAVRKRYANLQKSGVLCGVISMFHASFAHLFPCRVLVKTQGPRSTVFTKISAFARNRLNTTQFVSCVGAWDFEINFYVSNPKEIADFIQSLYLTLNETIVQVTTLNEISIKRSLSD